jgi:diguanylate cyclase (GGDEF)-like protein
VTARLVALVMLPVTVMCVLAGSEVLTRRSSAAQADTVDQGVTGLSRLVALRDALQAQHTAAAFNVRALQVGATPAVVSAFFGVDLGAEVAPARERANQAIVSLGTRSPISAAALQSLYADIDGGVITPEAAGQRLADILEVSNTAVGARLDELERKVRDTKLLAAVESVREASSLVDFASPQGIDLSSVWFPSFAATPEATAAALARFAAASADSAAAIDQLRELNVKSVVTNLGRIEADPQIQVFDQAVAATLLGKPLTKTGATADPRKVEATFRGYLAQGKLLDGLVKTAINAARGEARHLAASERAGFMTWAIGAFALALASIGIALWLARSIAKPLQDLAGYAHAVNEGDLDAEPSPGRNHGPRETRVAFGVFIDLVANLQLLDAKANALAHCNFDDPVLLEPLPGRLGQSLESSVALLSGSIVERDQLQTHLAHEATHDSLTGIANRPAAIIAIEAAMQRASRTGAITALLFVDLNDFKAVNDSHGHRVGDDVLRRVAIRISDDLRSGDFVARLGGDEFVVIAEGVTDVADATYLARRIIEILGEPIEVGALRLSIGAAIGVALTHDGPEEPLRLLARADAAMYRAKLHGGSAIEIFDAGLQQQMIERLDIETALSAALADPAGGGLQMHYQPVLDTMSGAMVGAEALIRWNRPGHGFLAPDSFIPVAEATSLIIDVDRWVLAEATRQLVEWSADGGGLAGVPVAVNISGRHLLSGRLPGNVQAALDSSGIDPHLLSIEITETVLLTDLVVAAAELDVVRALGVRVAIDDFGTGYTSLAHLQQLPIDTIKIDRSFISQLNVRRGSSLVRMVTDLGHAIDIKIVAEGVETGDEMNALQAMGADQLQGFLLSQPLEPAALSAWAHERVASGCLAFSATP